MTREVEYRAGLIADGSSAVIDEISYTAAEVNQLEGSIPVSTLVGANTLHQAILSKPASSDHIIARQQAVEELADKQDLRQELAGTLQSYRASEPNFTTLIKDPRLVGATAYSGIKKAAEALEGLQAPLQSQANQPESPLLEKVLRKVADFNDTDAASLLRGPVMYTPVGLRSREQAGLWPRLRFRHMFSGRVALMTIASIYAGRQGYMPPEAVTGTLAYSLLMGGYGTLPNSSGYNLKDSMWSYPTMYRPLHKHVTNTPEFTGTLDAVGELDLLVGLANLKHAMDANGHTTVFPTITDDERYHFRARQLKNPLLSLGDKRGEWLVANDVEFGDADKPLTFLTGPNSGGKSTLSKAIIQSQVLGQVGGAVPAVQAEISVADKIAYHVPQPPELGDETGRFGFELQRVRDILDASSAQSVTILDDCLDGTTHQERLTVLKNVMLAFRYLGGATLFSTHAHELVGDFEFNQEGQFWQVEFEDNRPTYCVRKGISHTSHATEIAAQHGFTRQQVIDALRASNIKPPEWL